MSELGDCRLPLATGKYSELELRASQVTARRAARVRARGDPGPADATRSSSQKPGQTRMKMLR
jgi:hypothetical protein